MARSRITRRQFNKLLTAMLLSGGARLDARTLSEGEHSQAESSPLIIKAAAIQMTPALANLSSNLEQAETLIKEALRKRAEWIILPEMFTTAAGFHPDMVKAITPVDGAPQQLLKRLARKGNAVIGGSFLASHKQKVFNTFVLAFPDGSTVQHNKDFPTYWENCYYQKGNDDGVLASPIGPVGSVLCWEFIRSATARRLFNKVQMVVGGSCWWTLPDDADSDSPRRAMNLKMLKQAPVRMARMLGVPVIHGSHAGPFEGFFSPDLPDVEYNSSYLGEAMIVDAKGNVLARRDRSQGKGVVLAEVNISKPSPIEPIPEDFWMPEEMPDDWKESWTRWFDKGADYFERVTAEYLKTGLINEYIPKYLR